MNARMKMPLTVLLVCACMLAGPRPITAQERNRESLRKELVVARELTNQGRYDEAMQRLTEISERYSNDPAGDFYKTVTLIWKSFIDAPNLVSGNRAFDADIEALLVAVVQKAEAIKARADKSTIEQSDALYYLGSASAIRARASFYQNHALVAAKSARTAQDLFEELLKLDPDYWDAYYAPGNLYYAIGLVTDTSVGKVATTVMSSKALPTGDTARGLNYLKIAADKSQFASFDAKLALLQIYVLGLERFAEALPIARELQAKYPDNQLCARYLLKIYAGLKNRTELTRTAQQVLARVKAGKPGFGAFMKAEAERALADASKL